MKKIHMKRISTVFVIVIAGLLALPAIAQAGPEITEHLGMCDASAAVAIGSTMFVVANDEDNVLRVYRRNKAGKPVFTFDIGSFLKPHSEHPEADIEGASRLGDRVYWITSHGANKDGEARPSRHRLFATDVKVESDRVTLTPVGTPYRDLVKDFIESPGLKDYQLGEAVNNPPESVKGLNIEGLSATPQGTLLIAFRNPILDQKALLVPLLNPREVVDGKAAKLGPPILLPLGGLGVRSIEYFEARDKFLIVAGPYDNKGDFKLYQWSGSRSEEPELIKKADLKGLQPEALIIYPGERTKAQLLSDDGGEQVEGKDCKKAKPEKRRFRSVWVTP
jgi:hypothetical protein